MIQIDDSGKILIIGDRIETLGQFMKLVEEFKNEVLIGQFNLNNESAIHEIEKIANSQ